MTRSPAWTGWAGCSAPAAGCCRCPPFRWTSRPTVVGLDPADRSAATTVRGQVAVATTAGRVVAIRLRPDQPPACPEAVAAIEAADWVVLGPGSWFTSVLPHLLVPDLARGAAHDGGEADRGAEPRRRSTARPTGFSPENHLEVLAMHAPAARRSTSCSPTARPSDGPASLRDVGRLARRLAGPGRPRRPRRPLPARPAAAGRGVPRRHGVSPALGSSRPSGRVRDRRTLARFGGRMAPMALTALVKDELSRLTIIKPC